LEFVRFGSTDLTVSRVGVGCAAIGGYDYGKVDDRDSVAAIRRALDLGVKFFDTADVYGFGHSEEILARALGKHRNEVTIATKFGVNWEGKGGTTRDISGARVVEALEGSLRRLKLDCIPVYQIHWHDFKTPLEETMEALKRCQEAGKVRFAGCCNFSKDLVEQAQAHSRLESLQLPYSLAQPGSREDVVYCHEKYRMAILSYSPLAQGFFGGKYGRNSKFEGTDLRRRSELFGGEKLEMNLALLERLRKVGARYGRTPAQVAIRWILEEPSITCVLTGIKRAEQIEENLGALGWSLTPGDMDFLGGREIPENLAREANRTVN
jgi:aryl-alcohol dehydrogenase-like predicted oxidoreductase